MDQGIRQPSTIPFPQEQENELEWYFEEHLRFPFTNQKKAQRAAKSIQDIWREPLQSDLRRPPGVQHV